MSGFLTSGPYLRIRTPRTIDGVNLKYDAQDRVIYKETHAPLTARKNFELENANRPKQVQHIIEVMGAETSNVQVQTPPIQNVKPAETKTTKKVVADAAQNNQDDFLK